MDKPTEENEEQEFILAEGPGHEGDHSKEKESRREIDEFSLAPVIQQIQDIRTFIAQTQSQL